MIGTILPREGITSKNLPRHHDFFTAIAVAKFN
jgi:hypothetical protein